MKRSPMKRSGWIKRKALSEERKVEARVFIDAVKARCMRDHLGPSRFMCERCDETTAHIEAHHLCSRTRGKGHEHLHNPEINGAGLCGHCHHLVTIHQCGDWRDWIKTRNWLEDGGRLA